MFGTQLPIEQRLKKLQTHLQQENPVLLDVVKSFRQLDRVAFRLGILDRDESFATRVPWWPMVAVMGTFSSGKSTFINTYLGQKLQSTGNQAVDDKFTVICFSADHPNRVLPGLALDADPRFPFYRMSTELEKVAEGEGRRVDAYLQLKTSDSAVLRGKILIDSPGFDADEQRNSTLRLSDHIIDLSDLVLVFFDARHPEPGAMHDTLEHLVSQTFHRHDSNKFLYILNQIDNAAREDNPEEVFGAWQRALAQQGLTAGRFYSIYDPSAAIPISDPKLRQRFEGKRNADMGEIAARLEQVEVERAYRIIGVLEQTAKRIQERAIPALRAAKQRWKTRVLWLDAVVFGASGGALAWWGISAGEWDGLTFTAPWLETLKTNQFLLVAIVVAGAALTFYVHTAIRKLCARTVMAGLRRDESLSDVAEWLAKAFHKNTKPWLPVLMTEPVGWGAGASKRLGKVLADAGKFVEALNDRFTDPSGAVPKGEKRPSAWTRAEQMVPDAAGPSAAALQAPPLDGTVGAEEDMADTANAVDVVKPITATVNKL